MSIFIERGIYFQNRALTKEEADKSFSISCDICCHRGALNGRDIDCERNCGIYQAHKQTIAILADIEKGVQNNA